MTLKTAKKVLVSAALGVAAAGLMAGSATAEWKPKGPINFMIAFTAGGGADTQARLIASELEKRKGWKIIPSNVTGKGGAVLARKIKDQPNDGTTIGMAVNQTFGYNMLATKNPGYGIKDFSYITTTAGSQMGVYAKTEKGWKTWDDVVKAAKGKTLKIGVMGQKLTDIAFLLGQKHGVKFNIVVLRGGRAVLNAINAGDVDVGFGAGIQNKAVRAGTLVQFLSAEDKRVKVSPNAPTLAELGIPFRGGSKFLVFGPKGIPADAQAEIAKAIADVLNDKSTKAADFVGKAFGGPQLFTGPALEKQIEDGIKESQALLKASS